MQSQHNNISAVRRKGRVPFVMLMLVLLLGACAEDFIDPFQNEGRYFTIYGFIDSQSINHKIRVIPITRQEAIIRRPSDIQAALDAEVTISDLSTGEVFEWEYSLEELSDQTLAHTFTSSFVVVPGRSYRLDVTRSDGVRAWAITEVPYVPDSAFYDLGPVSFSADSSAIAQQVYVPGDINPWRFEAIYSWSGNSFNRRVFVPYGRRGEPDGIGWVTTLSLADDQQAVFETIKESARDGKILDDTPLIITGMGLRMTMLDTNWQIPANGFDIDEFTLPSTTTNVNNGYGFFGSIGHYVQEWEACELSKPLGYEFAEANCGARDSDDDS